MYKPYEEGGLGIRDLQEIISKKKSDLQQIKIALHMKLAWNFLYHNSLC